MPAATCEARGGDLEKAIGRGEPPSRLLSAPPRATGPNRETPGLATEIAAFPPPPCAPARFVRSFWLVAAEPKDRGGFVVTRLPIFPLSLCCPRFRAEMDTRFLPLLALGLGRWNRICYL